MQSAGILDPEASKITSPTTRSHIETLWVYPNLPLITGTVSCLSKPYSFTNLRSLIISTTTLTISNIQVVIAIAIPSTVAFQDPLAIPLPMEQSKAETMIIQ